MRQQRGGRYQIIAGERRYHAAVQVGLRELPVVIREADDAEVMELALVENLQRKDLTAFEEAEALQQLAQRCRYTHEDMARKLGKSRTTITESLSLNNMPEEVRNLCRLADITSKSTLLQIVRQADPAEDAGAGREAGQPGRGDARGGAAAKPPSRSAARPKAFVFAFRPPTKAFHLRMSFNKGKVDKSEIIDALENDHQRASRRQITRQNRPLSTTLASANLHRPSVAGRKGPPYGDTFTGVGRTLWFATKRPLLRPIFATSHKTRYVNQTPDGPRRRRAPATPRAGITPSSSAPRNAGQERRARSPDDGGNAPPRRRPG